MVELNDVTHIECSEGEVTGGRECEIHLENGQTLTRQVDFLDIEDEFVLREVEKEYVPRKTGFRRGGPPEDPFPDCTLEEHEDTDEVILEC